MYVGSCREMFKHFFSTTYFMWRRIIRYLRKINYKQARQCTYKGTEVPSHNHFCCAKARSRVQLKCDGTRRRTGGEVKGKLANGVGSQYSYTTSEHGASSITTADAHTSAASSRLNWRPRLFKWTRPFR